MNEWSYISIPSYVYMAWYIVKPRGNFTFTYPIEKLFQVRTAGEITEL
jgi:hypothetical protein